MVHNPFDSIEAAHEYLQMLEKMVLEVQETSQEDLKDVALTGTGNTTRQLEALRLVHYKLDQLRHHVNASSRIMNDLRTMRRLLLRERQGAQKVESTLPARS